MPNPLDKLAPKIKLYKYLDKELEALKEVFNRNWDEKQDGWRYQSIDWLANRLDLERKELKEAIEVMWEDAMLHSSLIIRMKHVHMEFLDIALVALMGADKTRREFEALEKRLNEPKKEKKE